MTQTAELPDLDPYEHLTNAELAASVAAWPDDSEDQRAALVALARRAPNLGHNKPPLAEALDAEVEVWRRRSEEILALVGDAVIIDAESAKKVTDLAAKTKDLEDELDKARLARGKPFRDAQALVNSTFDALIRPLKLAREGEDRRGGLRGMLTVFDNKVRAEAEAERRRLEAEQRQREAEAAEAQKKAEEAARAGAAGQVNAELAAARTREAADQARLRAEAVRPIPIRSHLGQVSRRREFRFEITDLGATIAWLITQPGHKNNVEQSVRTIVGSYLRSLGVDAVARGVEIPGIEITVDLGTAALRR